LILLVEDLAFNYPGRDILKDISFAINKGEFVGIIGPNGSGKTTLIKNIAGFLEARGRVVVRGDSLSALSRKELARRIGVVPQRSQLKGEFTVKEVVEMGRYAYQKYWQKPSKKDEEIVDAVLKTLKIFQFKERKIGQLSGGEFQKVIIARALAQNPDILILDEATSNLDINHTIEIFQLLKRISNEKGIAVIAIIHDLNMAAQFCDRIMVLKNGKMIKMGNPEEIFKPKLLDKIFGLKARILLNPQNKRPFILPQIDLQKGR